MPWLDLIGYLGIALIAVAALRVSLFDLRRMRIRWADISVVALGGLCVGLSIGDMETYWPHAELALGAGILPAQLINAVMFGGILYLFAIVTGAALNRLTIGLGDVGLFAAAGTFVPLSGWGAFFVLQALVLAGFAGIRMIGRRRRGLRAPIYMPNGPAIVLTILAVAAHMLMGGHWSYLGMYQVP